MVKMRTVVLPCTALLMLSSVARPEQPMTVNWIRQIGTPELDEAGGVAADGLGNVYLSGNTAGSLGGPNVGGANPFLAKWDTAGSVLWVRQIGTPAFVFGAAADREANAYITGKTSSSLGGPALGSYDGFLVKYAPNGDISWSRQIATSAYDACYGVATDRLGYVYAIGHTQGSLGAPNAGDWDAFITKYNATGTQVWARQVGTVATETGNGVASDGAGNVFLCGGTTGGLDGTNLGGQDAFVRKFGPTGNVLWTRQFGSGADDTAASVSADAGGSIFVAGNTWGDMGGANAGGRDGYLAKLDPNGNLLWRRQLGTAGDDVALSVAVDGAGNAFVTGATGGNLGAPNAGGEFDAYVSKYDGNGNLLWVLQLGTSATETSLSVTCDELGNLFFGGNAYGDFGGPQAGVKDVYVAMLVPEPAGISLLTLAGAAALCRRRPPRRARA